MVGAADLPFRRAVYHGSHVTAVECVALAERTVARDVAADEAVAGGGERGTLLWTRPGRAGRPWGTSLRTDEAVGWPRRGRCEPRHGPCSPAIPGKLLQRSHVAREPLGFCSCTSCTSCSWRHSRIKLHILGETQLGPEPAISLWTRT